MDFARFLTRSPTSWDYRLYEPKDNRMPDFINSLGRHRLAGLGHQVLILKIRGSNPLGGTIQKSSHGIAGRFFQYEGEGWGYDCLLFSYLHLIYT